MTTEQLADLAMRAAAAACKTVGDPRPGVTVQHVVALAHAAVLVPEELRAAFIGTAYGALLDVAGMPNVNTGEPGGRWVRNTETRLCD